MSHLIIIIIIIIIIIKIIIIIVRRRRRRTRRIFLKFPIGSVDCTNTGANNTINTKAHSDTTHK